MKKTLLFLTASLFSANLAATTYWSNDELNLKVYHENTSIESQDNTNVNSFDFKTDHEDNYQAKMLNLSFKNFINGKDFLLFDVGHHFDGDSDIGFTENYRAPDDNSFQLRHNLENKESSFSKKYAKIAFGTDLKDYQIPWGSTLYLGIEVEKMKIDYQNISVTNIEQSGENNRLQNERMLYSLYFGYDTYKKMTDSLDWKIDFTLSPYFKSDTDREYTQYDGALENFETSQSVQGWYGSIETGLRYRFDSLNVFATYSFDYYNGKGDMGVNRTIAAGDDQVEGKVKNYKQKSHTIGINLNYPL